VARPRGLSLGHQHGGHRCGVVDVVIVNVVVNARWGHRHDMGSTWCGVGIIVIVNVAGVVIIVDMVWGPRPRRPCP